MKCLPEIFLSVSDLTTFAANPKRNSRPLAKSMLRLFDKVIVIALVVKSINQGKK